MDETDSAKERTEMHIMEQFGTETAPYQLLTSGSGNER
jgi:hypothetical protein